MKRLGTILAATLLSATAATAQQYETGGVVFGHEILNGTDLVNLSQNENFGTARVTAMGGAFTSLGADLSSMSINPAGLGMYRHDEVSLTPLLTVTNASTAGTNEWGKNGKTRFSFANFGAAINIAEHADKALTSLTFGFGMNRVADFNTRQSFSTESRYDYSQPNRFMPTIAEVMAHQLYNGGIVPPPDTNGVPFEGPLDMEYISPKLWPAVLGYDSYMLSYRAPSQEGGNGWYLPYLGNNASVLHSYEVLNSGSINEFNLSMGANFNNFIYVGASLGIQSVYKKSEIIYQEEYGYFDQAGNNTASIGGNGQPLDRELRYSTLYQNTVVDGAGINFKIGVIVRPTQGLRLGVAYHSPTYYSLDRSYNADVLSEVDNLDNRPSDIYRNGSPVLFDEDGNNWRFISPSRLLTGISYTFGKWAIVSVDYERKWYNGIRFKDVPSDVMYSNDEFRNNYKAVNILRAGFELRPLPMLAIRGGGGYSESMLAKDETLYPLDFQGAPVSTENYYITAGIGCAFSRNVSLDLSYQYQNNTLSRYQLFYAQNPTTMQFDTASGWFETQMKRHFISMTLAFRF